MVVSVKDSGVGIPAPMLSKVFDMFTQVDRNLDRSQGGLGIGLSIVQRLVAMHGGSVEARSEGHGKGSEFVVRLPLALSIVSQQALDAGEPGRPTDRRRVLVVDDNRDAAMSMAMLLDLMGNETQTAHDGQEALELIPVFQPEVVLLDIGMPRLNGYDTARRIREQPRAGGIVLIALTGWGQEEDRRRSQEAGFSHHLTKPVDPAQLEKLLVRPQADTARAPFVLVVSHERIVRWGGRGFAGRRPREVSTRDHGTLENLDPIRTFTEGIAAGKLSFAPHGERLNGRPRQRGMACFLH